jgi:hypothetical protein
MLPEELDAFLSKTDFDFSTVEGWEEFFAERRRGGNARDADGIQIRDLKNYAVGTANIISSGSPSDVRINIRQPGSGLALAPGVIYINYPDASGARQVIVEPVGMGRQDSQNIEFQAGGGGTDFSPHWDALYYIVIKSEDLPGQGVAKTVAGQVLNRALKGAGWLSRRGFQMIRMGGSSYDVVVNVGTLPPVRNQFMEQEVLSEEALEQIKATASDAYDYLFETTSP